MGQPRFFVIVLASGFVAAAAHAAPPLPSPTAPGTAPPIPAVGADSVPEVPDVKDTMLEPVPPAPNTLSSWRDALRLVHDRSTQLRISRAQIEGANGATRRAMASALPKLTTQAALTHVLSGPTTVVATTGVFDQSTRLNGSLNFDQPLINLGAWYAIGTAKERARGTEFDEHDTERQLLDTMAQAAIAVITQTRVAETSRVSLLSALSTYDLTQRRAALGAATQVDVLRAAQEVEQSRAQIVSSDEALREARETLGSALGDTEPWSVSPDIRVEDLERTASIACKPVESLDARADIRSLKTEVHAAERDRNSVDYLFVPTLDLTSNLGYSSYTLPPPQDDHWTWTIGGAFAWTLYDGGDRYGLRQVNEAALAVAREKLTQKKRDITIQVAQADRAIAVAETNLAVSTSARNIAKQSARLSRLAFVNGSGTSFDLVDTARTLRAAEIDLLIKDFQVFQAKLTAFLVRANCSI